MTMPRAAREKIAAIVVNDCFKDSYSSIADFIEVMDGQPRKYHVYYFQKSTGTIPVALMLTESRFGGNLELWNVCTARNMRRRGCAETLIKLAFSHWRFKLKKPSAFVSLYVLKSNAPAVAFYRKLGFDVVTDHDLDPATWKMRIALDDLIVPTKKKAVAKTDRLPKKAAKKKTVTKKVPKRIDPKRVKKFVDAPKTKLKRRVPRKIARQSRTSLYN